MYGMHAYRTSSTVMWLYAAGQGVYTDVGDYMDTWRYYGLLRYSTLRQFLGKVNFLPISSSYSHFRLLVYNVVVLYLYCTSKYLAYVFYNHRHSNSCSSVSVLLLSTKWVMTTDVWKMSPLRWSLPPVIRSGLTQVNFTRKASSTRKHSHSRYTTHSEVEQNILQ